MQVTLASVISLNGKITKGNDPNIHAWSSAEDWKHFVMLRESSDVVVIDSGTYETVQPQAEKGKLRIVLTDTPERFATQFMPGQMEFIHSSPKDLVERLIKEGYQKVLVAGGKDLCSDFLACRLFDDIYISFEPVLFGAGESLLGGKALDVSLQLESVKKLNERGTLLAHYTVIKE